MRFRLPGTLALLTLAGLALGGCSSTPKTGEYSSLPPPPRHVSAAQPVQGGGSPPAFMSESALTPDQYPDLLDRIRAGYSLPDVQDGAVDREVEAYRARPDFLDRTFRRGQRYLYYIVNEIEKRGMPLELALLPVVESAFNPVAYSRSRASGLWQFIPSTGKHYGLQQNWWIDERRDVLRSTTAALDYLQYLHQYFNGDWYLAIAAYNGGEGTVSRAVQRNADRGRPTDFFSLDLRAETESYVPKLLAIKRIVADPASYGLEFAAIPNEPYFNVVDPGRQMNLGEAAVLAGITRDDIFALNPAFNRMTTPPKGPHRLLLPVDRVQPFQQALLTDDGSARVAAAALEPPPPTRHRVRRGETLSSIARRYDVTVTDIRQVNGLRNSTIHAGETLVIPSPAPSATLADNSPARVEIAAQPAASPPEPMVHVVKSGDTLYAVARRYGVSVPAITDANEISASTPLKVGARLEIPGRTAGGAGRSGGSPDLTRMTYDVKRGDTLSQIADRFSVSVQQLMSWNHLRRATSLRAGQRLVVYADPRKVNGG
jgi:membrane-bound lytic murein transglycosylase D